MIKNLKKLFQNYRWLFVVFFLLLIFGKLLSLPLKLSIFLFISIFLITIFPKKFRLGYILFSIFLGTINLILVTFALIPQPKNEINISKFFENQKNYLKIYKKDPNNILKNNFATLIIKRRNRIFTYKLWKIKNFTKIEVFQNDNIFYESRTKNLNTFINLYLRDGTVIRILPKTYLNLSKIFKDPNNLLNSKTKISLKRGNIRFRVIKTIVKDDNFNIQTPHGLIIIRGTAGIVGSQKDDTLAYSYDHLIQLVTKSGKKFFITKNEIAIFNDKQIITITNNLNLLKNYINQNIINLIKQFNLLDQKDIQKYKENFESWIKNQINLLNKTNFINKLCYYKLKILSFFSDKYKDQLEKFEFTNFLLGKTTYLDNENFIRQAIFIPFENNIKKLRNIYFQQKAKFDLNYMKNYIYYRINQLLEEGKNNQKLKELLDKIKNF